MNGANSAAAAKRGTCVFCGAFAETHTRATGFKDLHKRLETLFPSRERIDPKRDALTDSSRGFSSLSHALAPGTGVELLVMGNPRAPLSVAELSKLSQWVVEGGHLMVASSAGGLGECNVNEVLLEFGMSVNRDGVVRSVLHKYLHPKEVFISDGIANRAIVEAAGPRGGKGALLNYTRREV